MHEPAKPLGRSPAHSCPLLVCIPITLLRNSCSASIFKSQRILKRKSVLYSNQGPCHHPAKARWTMAPRILCSRCPGSHWVPSAHPSWTGWQLTRCWLHSKPSSGHESCHLNPSDNKCANPSCHLFLQTMSRLEDLGTVFMNI